MSATEFKIEELGNKTYSYKDLGCSDWPLETVKPKVYIMYNVYAQHSSVISAESAFLGQVDMFQLLTERKKM